MDLSSLHGDVPLPDDDEFDDHNGLDGLNEFVTWLSENIKPDFEKGILVGRDGRDATEAVVDQLRQHDALLQEQQIDFYNLSGGAKKWSVFVDITWPYYGSIRYYEADRRWHF